MLPFEFVIEGPPVSQQTRRRARRRAWADHVRRRAMSHWPADEPPALGPIRVVITHVFAGASSDLDNLAKPVLDALQGLAYEDDGQVTDIVMKKRDLARNLRLEALIPLLLNALDRGEEFLHVLVEEAPDQEIVA
ncbi:MAG: RusA family crossover junction endodeoxyribonuclease [Geminicoccaceae bacterium]